MLAPHAHARISNRDTERWELSLPNTWAGGVGFEAAPPHRQASAMVEPPPPGRPLVRGFGSESNRCLKKLLRNSYQTFKEHLVGSNGTPHEPSEGLFEITPTHLDGATEADRGDTSAKNIIAYAPL